MNLTSKYKVGVFVVGLPLGIAIGSVFLLTAIFGPSDWGVRCVRSPVPECQILQTHFFGVFGNSSFSIPEAEIRDAETVRSHPVHGGHHIAPVYTVDLQLDPKSPYTSYPVLSYQFESQADSSTKKLNAYFEDKSVPLIQITDDVLTPFLVEGFAPIALVGALVFAVWFWRLRKAKVQTS